MKRSFIPAVSPTTHLKPPTPAQIGAVTDVLEHRWSHNALAIQDRLTEAVDLGLASDAQKWAIAGGISTEKVLLLKGRPTEITGHIHAHRHELGPLMDKLARSIGMGTQATKIVGIPVGDASSTRTLPSQNAKVLAPMPASSSPGSAPLSSPDE